MALGNPWTMSLVVKGFPWFVPGTSTFLYNEFFQRFVLMLLLFGEAALIAKKELEHLTGGPPSDWRRRETRRVFPFSISDRMGGANSGDFDSDSLSHRVRARPADTNATPKLGARASPLLLNLKLDFAPEFESLKVKFEIKSSRNVLAVTLVS